MGLARLGFDELPSRKTSRFLVAGQQHHHRAPGTEARFDAGANNFKRQRAVGLHIENARAVRPIGFDTPGPLPQRTARVNGVGVPQD